SRQRIEPWALDAPHHRYHTAAVLGDLHADVRVAQDAARHEPSRDLTLELGWGTPGSLHAADVRQRHLAVGTYAHALLAHRRLRDRRDRCAAVGRTRRVGLCGQQLRDADVEQVVRTDAITVASFFRASRREGSERLVIPRAHEIADAPGVVMWPTE